VLCFLTKATPIEEKGGRSVKTIAICACILLLPMVAFALEITDNGHAWRKSDAPEKMEVATKIGFFFRTPATF
jgi:hypothetical protein